ncbi:hypothetical protein QBC44DRAFT_253640 [Cladorrhinum sp. PSN332]|nr:hypothetical protein QBC44DRAFT_253640 [Cladorrhinum sp. PSN332]
MSALHYSWIAGGPQALQQGSEMEETYLLHKLEAMRLVNELLGDPERCTSDGCLSLIAALALAESGMGNLTAAQAHLNGLFTLLDMRKPEQWQHRFYGMLQRVILMAGSFIASSSSSSPRTPPASKGDATSPINISTETGLGLLATKLSPFYLATAPGMEACKADLEGEVLINTLSRLTLICYPPSQSQSQPRTNPGGNETLHPHHPETTRTLLKDAEAYISSLLFKPHAPSDRNGTAERSSPELKNQQRVHPYQHLTGTTYPSGSRAWATAAWLYLRFVLGPLLQQQEQQQQEHAEPARQIDPHLLRLLLDKLKADIQATEDATRAGTYSQELWGWKIIVALHALHALGEEDQDDEDIQMTDIIQDQKGKYASLQRHQLQKGSSDTTGSDTAGSQDGGDEQDEQEEQDEQAYIAGSTKQLLLLRVPPTESEYVDSMKGWFGAKLSVWSRAAQLDDWNSARQMLARIVWPAEDAEFRGDAAIEAIWWDAVRGGGGGGGGYNTSESDQGGYETQATSSMVMLIDPLLWE